MMATKVFISYRRDDSAGHAGRVHDRLEREFGRDLLFMDVDAVPLGDNFVKALSDEVAKCDVLLAVIGPNWLNARDEDGNRRLDNPHDFVRIEIGAALQRNIPVIPILLDGAKVPKANQLPKELEELSLRNGLYIRHASFHNDVDRLIRGLKGQMAKADAEKRRRDEDERRRQEAEDRRRLDEAAAKKRRRDEEQRRLEEERRRTAKEETRRKPSEKEQQQRPARAQWHAIAGAAALLLLVACIGLWVLWQQRAMQPGSRGEAEARARAEQAQKERLAAVQAEEERKAKAAAVAAQRKAAEAVQHRLFTIRSNTEVVGHYDERTAGLGRDVCEQKCAQTLTCLAFSYLKPTAPGAPAGGVCYVFSDSAISLVPSNSFDSGILQPISLPEVAPSPGSEKRSR